MCVCTFSIQMLYKIKVGEHFTVFHLFDSLRLLFIFHSVFCWKFAVCLIRVCPRCISLRIYFSLFLWQKYSSHQKINVKPKKVPYFLVIRISVSIFFAMRHRLRFSFVRPQSMCSTNDCQHFNCFESIQRSFGFSSIKCGKFQLVNNNVITTLCCCISDSCFSQISCNHEKSTDN